MKIFCLSLIGAFATTAVVRADDASVKLTDVHLCCQSCVKGVQSAISKVKGVTATADSDEGTISLKGPDVATVQKGVDALTTAGYFGKSSDPAIKVNADTGAKGQKVQSLQIDDVHLCCGKCVKSVTEALSAVSGVQTNTAVKGAKSFTVTGDFNDKEAFAALQKAGLTGKVAK